MGEQADLTPRLRAFEIDDLAAYGGHVRRHLAESGAGGQPTFTTYSRSHHLELEAWLEERAHQLLLPIDEAGWRRAWLLWDERRVVGHLELCGPGLQSALHRCRLGMGLEAPYRGQGWGKRMLERALTWVGANRRLAWVDLDVFAHNAPARALYRGFGFEEVGVHQDALRVDGQSIDSVAMTRRM